MRFLGHRAADWLLLALLSLFLGSSYMFQDLAVKTLPPATVTGLRMAVAALAVTALALAWGHRLPRAPGLWGHFLAIGLIGNVLPFYVITWGQEGIDSSLAGIIIATAPTITLVMAHFLVRGERMTRGRLLGFAVGFAGIVVLLAPGMTGEDAQPMRLFAVLLGAACFALTAILSARLPDDLPPLVTASGAMLAAAAAAVPLALLVEGWTPVREATGRGWGLAVMLGLFATGGASILYFRIVASAGPAFLSLTNYLVPLVAVACGVLFLGETVGANAWAGMALVLAGVWLGERAKKKAMKAAGGNPRTA